MKKIVTVLSVVFFTAASLGALDFGLVLQDEAKFSQEGFYNDTTVIPWLSFSVGPKTDFYMSGNFQFEYNYDEWNIIPDVGRFDVTYTWNDSFYLQFGRVPFFDASGLVSMGLYDGVLANFTVMENPLRAALFYTGLLNKKNAQIILTTADLMDYADDDVFFASRRIVAAVDYGINGVFGSKNVLTLGLLGQFDLRGDEPKLNSQYLSLSYAFNQISNIEIGIDAVAAFEETKDDPFRLASALTFDLSWSLPYNRSHNLFTSSQWASGDTDAFIPYRPINDISVGEVFSPSISGLVFLQLGYGARLLPTLYGEFQANYFIRTDLNTVYDPDIDPSSDSHLLGGEFAVTAIWSPLSDLALIAETGIFLPRMGGAFMDDAPVQWLASLILVLSF